MMDELTLLIGRQLLRRNYIPNMDIGDLINEVYAKVFWRYKKLEIKRVNDYFISSLLNAMKDHVRQEKREQRLFSSLNTAIDLPDTNESVDPELVYYYKQLSKKVYDMILNLDNKDHQRIVFLYFIEGEDYKEIANKSNCSIQNCRKIVSRFKQHMKEVFEDEI